MYGGDVAYEQYQKINPQNGAQPQDDGQREALRIVNRQVSNYERATEYKMREVLRCTAYVAGRQSLSWAPTVGWVVTQDEPIVENQCGVIVNKYAATLTKPRPIPKGRPLNGDDQELERARCRSKYIEAEWQRERMVQKMHPFAKGLLTAGIQFFKVTWDPELGEVYTPNADDKALIAAYAQVHAQSQSIVDEPFQPPQDLPPLPIYLRTGRTGGNRVQVCGMHEVGFEPGASGPETARWAFHRVSMHIDQVHAMWPEQAKYVVPDAQLYRAFWYRTNNQSSTGAAEPALVTDHVTVYEYYEVPSARFPRGRVVVCTPYVWLQISDHLPGGVLPFALATDNPVDSTPYGRGQVADLIPLQRALNKRIDTLDQTADLAGGTIIFARKGSISGGAEAISDEPVQIVELETVGQPPTTVTLPVNPVHMLAADMFRGSIMTVSNSNSVSMGDIKSNTSGRALGLLDEQMAVSLGPTARSIESAILRVGELMLTNARLYFPPAGMVTITGTDNALEAFTFYTGDITETRCMLEADSMLPRFTAYRQEKVMAALQSGVFQLPPDIRRLVLKSLEFGDLAGIDNPNTKLEAYGREVVFNLVHKNPVPPAPYYPQVEVASVLRDYMMTQDFRQQVDAHPYFAWYLAWCDFIEAQKQAGVSWWLIQPQPYPAFPPQAAPPQAPPQPNPTPPGAPTQEPDGDEPAPQDNRQAMLQQLMMRASQGGIQGQGAPLFATAGQPNGPGVGSEG